MPGTTVTPFPHRVIRGGKTLTSEPDLVEKVQFLLEHAPGIAAQVDRFVNLAIVAHVKLREDADTCGA